MLTIYRRHRSDCLRSSEPEIRVQLDGDLFIRKGQRKCSCPLWVDGFCGGREVRKSLRTRDWQKAQDRGKELLDGASATRTRENEAVTIERAKAEFLADAVARKLKNSTIERYKMIFRQLEKFAADQGIRYLVQSDLPTLRRFRASWKDGDLAGKKKLERLRCFFRFAHQSEWITDNPTLSVKSPKVTLKLTLPFEREDMIRILAAANERIRTVRSDARNRARRLRALVLLLRYTGLRISDAISCPVERLREGKIWLYTHKTGQHVYCPLPEFVVKELESIPRVSDRYWFWTGKGSLETARKKWSQSLSTLFEEAKVEGGHAHRFRDTFASELLLSGTPIESVSTFLGHASIRVTERHYAPWVRARQEQAEEDVQRSWTLDPVVALESNSFGTAEGTNQVQEKRRLSTK